MSDEQDYLYCQNSKQRYNLKQFFYLQSQSERSASLSSSLLSVMLSSSVLASSDAGELFQLEPDGNDLVLLEAVVKKLDNLR